MKRDKYLNQLIALKDDGMVKVITGIRRCGKSYLLNKIYKDYLISIGIPQENIIYLDLEDTENSYYWDPIYLNDYVISLASKVDGKAYVFLDEIQHVFSIKNPALTDGKHVKPEKDDTDDLITFVNTALGLAKKENIDLYITGSNSKMLSSDIMTEFRDKGEEIHVSPLSFEEFLPSSGLDPQSAFSEYMLHGGMPRAVLKKTGEEKEDYLKNLYELTYLKDIIEHNHLSRFSPIDEIGKVLASCVGQLINGYSIAADFTRLKRKEISPLTVQNYIGLFRDSFLIEEAERYDIKGRKFIGATKKYYFSDVGLRNALLNFNHDDDGQVMENILYNELRYRGYKVDVGVVEINEKNQLGNGIRKQYEVDFIAVKGGKKYYIQSAFHMASEEKKKQEKKSLSAINDFNSRIIVVRDPIPPRRDEKGIVTIGVVEFLSQQTLDF